VSAPHAWCTLSGRVIEAGSLGERRVVHDFKQISAGFGLRKKATKQGEQCKYRFAVVADAPKRSATGQSMGGAIWVDEGNSEIEAADRRC